MTERSPRVIPQEYMRPAELIVDTFCAWLCNPKRRARLIDMAESVDLSDEKVRRTRSQLARMFAATMQSELQVWIDKAEKSDEMMAIPEKEEAMAAAENICNFLAADHNPHTRKKAMANIIHRAYLYQMSRIPLLQHQWKQAMLNERVLR